MLDTSRRRERSKRLQRDIIGATGDATPSRRVAVATELSHTPLPRRDRAPAAERARKAVGALAEYAAAIAHQRDVGPVRDDARAALSRYVEELRAERVAPERALITVKVVIRSLSSAMEIRAREAFVDEIVRWCVDAYYGTPSADGASLLVTGPSSQSS